MLSLHQLRCFLTVYEQGSLTAAAEELGYAQPSVSEQVRALEKSVGTALFLRVGRGVVRAGAWWGAASVRRCDRRVPAPPGATRRGHTVRPRAGVPERRR